MPDFMIQDILLALGLLASLALFFSLKREMRRQNRRHTRAIEDILAKLDALEPPETGTLADTRAESTPAPVAVRSGLNIHRRVQAVRLLRRGEDIAHVSAALGVPRGEIELLIRVQRLIAGRSEKAIAGKTT